MARGGSASITGAGSAGNLPGLSLEVGGGGDGESEKKRSGLSDWSNRSILTEFIELIALVELISGIRALARSILRLT